METFYKVGEGEIGFGQTEEEAEQNLQVYICRKDITLDKTGKFMKRRKELSPWMPRPNMIHISGVGCLVYENLHLTNTKTGKTVYIDNPKANIFSYLSKLFDKEVTFEDIMVVLRPELDALFKHISPEFTSIKDLPHIRVLNSTLGFKPRAVYSMYPGYFIGVSKKFVGLKRLGDDMYYVVQKSTDDLLPVDLAYIGYRMGIRFLNKEIVDFDEEEYEEDDE